MNGEFLQKIISSQKTCYFVSPHYDDAVLSAGALASYLKGSNRIVVINVFTQASPKPYTFSAKAYLRQCGYTNADHLYADRTAEDGEALSNLADEVINLGFTDALWRSRDAFWSRYLGKLLPELGKIYPTYKFHIIKGKIAHSDAKTVSDIKDKLRSFVDPEKAIIFCPLGVGNHVDHIITRAVCDELFLNPLHWTDYPYSMIDATNMQAVGMKSYSFDQEKSRKKVLIRKYNSQYKALFPGTLQLEPEVFYYE